MGVMHIRVDHWSPTQACFNSEVFNFSLCSLDNSILLVPLSNKHGSGWKWICLDSWIVTPMDVTQIVRPSGAHLRVILFLSLPDLPASLDVTLFLSHSSSRAVQDPVEAGPEVFPFHHTYGLE